MMTLCTPTTPPLTRQPTTRLSKYVDLLGRSIGGNRAVNYVFTKAIKLLSTAVVKGMVAQGHIPCWFLNTSHILYVPMDFSC